MVNGGAVEEQRPGNIGPYRVTRQIGRGGMGVVFEARALGSPRANEQAIALALELVDPIR